MIKLNKKYSLVGLGLFIALLLAFFPTSSFINNPFVVDAQLKQQHYNETGIFTISPIEAAKYYSYNNANCYWIDVRDAKEFTKEHLKPAINQDIAQLQNSSWNPDDLILIYGNNTKDAQEAVALLRQVKNARAYAVKGGFQAIKEYLIDPIGLTITSQLSDKDLNTLMELRSKLSGEKISTNQLLEKSKGGKQATIKEGC